MSAVSRTWLAFAALGTGLIHLALVISSPLPYAVVLAVFGFTEFGWGVWFFTRDSLAHPRAVLTGALVPIGFWAAASGLATVLGSPGLSSSLRFTPLALALPMQLFAAVLIAAHLRRGSDLTRPSVMPPAGRYLVGLMIGGLLVGSITTPALASTEAGTYAHPHGEHLIEAPSHGH